MLLLTHLTDHRHIIDINIMGQNKSRIRLRSQIEADSNKRTHLSFELQVPNLTGLEDSLSCGIKTSGLSRVPATDFEYRLPLPTFSPIYDPVFSILFSRYNYASLPGGFDQENKSITSQVEFYSHLDVKHSLGLVNMWTHIKSSNKKTPLVIREQAGHFLKSYLRYAILYDTRHYNDICCEGIMFKLTNDLTTNLFKKGTNKFARQEAQFQVNRFILPQHGLLGQINLFAGTLWRAEKIDISDRFFPGGVPSFRGMESKSFGPNVRRHPLGVMSYLTAGLHLYPILPGTAPDSRLNDIIRPQVFVNLGTSGYLTTSSRLDLNEFKDSISYTAGFGLVGYIGTIRLEVNYCFPLISRDGDAIVGGLQFGFNASG